MLEAFDLGLRVCASKCHLARRGHNVAAESNCEATSLTRSLTTDLRHINPWPSPNL